MPGIFEIREMFKSVIAGVGHYVPENIVTNDDLSQLMTTNDEWITERTGIKERRHRKNRTDAEETTSFYGLKASEIALKNANLTAKDIDYIVFATLSPDYFFPGSGVLLQDMLGCGTIGAGRQKPMFWLCICHECGRRFYKIRAV